MSELLARERAEVARCELSRGGGQCSSCQLWVHYCLVWSAHADEGGGEEWTIIRIACWRRSLDGQ